MRGSKRIDFSLLDDNLKELLGASTKIFPINTYEDLPTSKQEQYYRILNGSHRNEIYVWDDSVSEYVLIGADDKEIYWSDILQKPVSYPPSPHQHVWADIVDVPEAYKPDVHEHDDRYYTEQETDELLEGKANVQHVHLWEDIIDKPLTFPPSPHDHDSRYYTETEVDDKLKAKADVAIVSTHTLNNVVHITQAEREAWNKANTSYTHSQLTATSTWNISHNLGKHPSVTITDSSGNVVVGDVQYVDENNIIVSFTSAFAGNALLN